MPATQRIEVEGVAKSLKILRSLDSELAKDVRRQLRTSVKPVVHQAKQNLPGQALTNWGPWMAPRGRNLAYDGRTVKRGILAVQQTTAKRTRRGGYKPIALLELQNKTPAGAAFELAGAFDPDSTFNRNIARKHGRPKRVLFKAWDDRGDNVDQDIEDAVNRIEREITQKLSRP